MRKMACVSRGSGTVGQAGGWRHGGAARVAVGGGCVGVGVVAGGGMETTVRGRSSLAARDGGVDSSAADNTGVARTGAGPPFAAHVGGAGGLGTTSRRHGQRGPSAPE